MTSAEELALPELPDVEATRYYLLSTGLVGHKMTGAELMWPRAVRTPSSEILVEGIRGRTIQGLERRAKFLVMPLTGGPKLVFHLRMTGSLLVQPVDVPRPAMTRNVFTLDDGRELRFVDPRKLGQLWLVEDTAGLFQGLGPEPLEASFIPHLLGQRLNGRHVPIKALLCDQNVVAGIGNIYADEILFLAGISPLRSAADLSQEETERLHHATREVLACATEKLARLMPLGGPPSETLEGSQGLMVPRSKGSPCPRCGTTMERVPVRGRSSYYCPSCQV